MKIQKVWVVENANQGVVQFLLNVKVMLEISTNAFIHLFYDNQKTRMYLGKT